MYCRWYCFAIGIIHIIFFIILTFLWICVSQDYKYFGVTAYLSFFIVIIYWLITIVVWSVRCLFLAGFDLLSVARINNLTPCGEGLIKSLVLIWNGFFIKIIYYILCKVCKKKWDPTSGNIFTSPSTSIPRLLWQKWLGKSANVFNFSTNKKILQASHSVIICLRFN